MKWGAWSRGEVLDRQGEKEELEGQGDGRTWRVGETLWLQKKFAKSLGEEITHS